MKRITALILALLMVLSLTACGKEKDPASVVMIKEFCESFKLMDKEKMASYFDDESIAGEVKDFTDEAGGEALEEFIRTLASGITYSVTSAEENEDSAKVAVEFIHADASPLYTAVMSEYMIKVLGLLFTEGTTEEQFEELFEEILKAKTAEIKPDTVTTAVNFQCVKKDGKWLIGSPVDENLLNVLTFNMLKSMEDFANSFAGEADLKE